MTADRRNPERGAVLIFVAVGIVVIIAFSAFAVDFGVLWASRHQAQNAADAAAHAAAEQITWGDPGDQTAAKNAAVAIAVQNKVWGQAPDVNPADITFPPCPPGAPGVPDTCVRANVFRNQGRSPLPMYFGQILGLTQQGVKATATAQMFIGDETDCVKPFAIPDKWDEINPMAKAWDPTDEFNAIEKVGNNWNPLPNPDTYTPPSQNSTGTGFSLPTDYGRELTLKNGNPQDTIAPGWFYPVKLNPDDDGGDDYRWNIGNCNTRSIGPGTVLDQENGNMVGPTQQGMDDLIALDPDADWDPNSTNNPFYTSDGKRGAPSGGCMTTGGCYDADGNSLGRSPRLVAIALFNPDLYAQTKMNGSSTVTITHVMGFWINEVSNQGDITGYIMFYPATAKGSSQLASAASFLRTVILVR